MSRLREVFDNQKFYWEAFKESYQHSDARKIVLAYKVNLVLNSPMEELGERAPAKLKYAVSKARNLVWALLIQALLNDPKLSDYLEWYGVRSPEGERLPPAYAKARILQNSAYSESGFE